MRRSVAVGIGVGFVLFVSFVSLASRSSGPSAPPSIPSTGSDIPGNVGMGGVGGLGGGASTGGGSIVETAPNTPTFTSQVSIDDFTFSPQTISVPVGTTVTWTNNDSAAHTVTGDGSSGLGSGVLTSGSSTYSFKFTEAGTFTYHCSLHPIMTGAVIVMARQP